ncbi:hypothetical protein TNCV_1809241 [Trichonephila clavipes]|nr:hypothetical protein TNCV_1809241 [Trichonephila clavipes]
MKQDLSYSVNTAQPLAPKHIFEYSAFIPRVSDGIPNSEPQSSDEECVIVDIPSLKDNTTPTRGLCATTTLTCLSRSTRLVLSGTRAQTRNTSATGPWPYPLRHHGPNIQTVTK